MFLYLWNKILSKPILKELLAHPTIFFNHIKYGLIFSSWNFECLGFLFFKKVKFCLCVPVTLLLFSLYSMCDFKQQSAFIRNIPKQSCLISIINLVWQKKIFLQANISKPSLNSSAAWVLLLNLSPWSLILRYHGVV